MSKFTKFGFKFLDVLVIFIMTFGAPMSVLADPSPTGATIASDLADYAPGATVTLSGMGWAAGESVHIFVNDDVNQQWSLDSNPDPVADASGNFTYQFDLPDLFVATYSVTATGATSGTATTTFTDAIPNNVSMLTWRTSGGGAWIQGTLNANNSNYKEGEVVPFRIELGTLATSGNPYSAAICRDYQTGTVFGYTQLLPFNTSRAATPGGTITSSSVAGAWPAGTFQGVNITVTGVTETGGPGACGSTQRETIVTFNATASGPQYLLWGGRLSSPSDAGVGFGNSASFYPGGSLQMRLESPDKTAGINPSGIIQLATITVTKIVDSGSATPDQWCFNISPNPNNVTLPLCPAPGQNSVQFLGLNSGSYTITETNVSGYAFASGSGTSCTFSGSTATASVTAAAGGATNASCTFHNALQQGTLTVIKHVVNDNGGTATADQWSIHVKSGASEVTGSPQAGAEAPGTSYTLTNGTYNVSETGGPSGYTFTGFSGDCDSSGNVTVVAGQNKTCTLTNNDNAASLILVKHVVNNNGGTADASAWTLSAGSHSVTGSETGAEATNQAGTYNLSESGPSGYTNTSITCDNSTGEVTSVTVGLGETVTCTFVNDDNATALYLVKHVENNNGGTADASAWTLSAGSHSVTGSETGALATNQAGTYDLSESSVDGYTNTSITCDNSTGQVTSVTVGLGETVTCTFVNDDNAASLILVKHVNNDNGGTADASAWTLSAGSNSVTGSETGAEATNQAGTYNLSETGPSGYTNTSLTCDNSTGQVTSVTVGLGETVTCTFVNDDNAASLILVKHVNNDNGGTADASAWTLSAGSNSVTGSETGAEATNQAGTYNLSESSVTGYTNTSITCDNSTGQVTSVTVGLGETVTCTFVNDDDAASLILVKHVNSDNGGTATASAWTLSAGSHPVTGSESGAEATDQAGTYDLSESSVDGYSNTSITCDNNPGVEVTSVTLGLGETITCTFVNDDNAPALYLVKHVNNDNGGDAEASDWTLSAGSNTVTGSETGALATDQTGTYALSETSVDGYTNTSITCDNNPGVEVTSVTLGLGETITCTFVNDDDAASLILVKHVENNNGGTADASAWTLSAGSHSVTGSESGAEATDQAGTYNLSETGPSGYSLTSLTCDNSTGQVDSVTVGLGETVTCTFVNDDNAASLILVKHVVNNNGGTATASGWTLSAGSHSVTGSETGAEATDQAGTYNLSETSVTGYTNTSLTCDNSTGQVTSVTVGLGETVTCIFVNDDNAASLILVKHVVNNNGGTASASAWTLSAGSHSVTGSESGALATDQAGTYNLSESSVTGYTNTSITCDNSTGQVTSVTVGLGETVTCTFVNDDNAPSLTLNKVVVNNNGGTAAESDWTLTANGGAAGTLSGAGAAGNADVVSDSTFKAGTYALSESAGPSGYSASSWSCVKNGGAPASGSSITLGLGDSATCTITNDDIAPQLKLVKTVTNNNGGTAAANDWDLVATGSGGFTELTPAAANATFRAVTAGVNYALSETGPSGYAASNFSCDGGSQAGNNIQLAVGQSVTCTINNNDIAPSLTLNKVVVNDNGGTAVESAWTLTANGGSSGTLTGAGAAGNADVVSGSTFKTGTYALSETAGPVGYTASAWSCVKNGGAPVTGSSITLGLGDTATCTITNNDQPGTIIIQKIVKGTTLNTSFNFTTTGTGYTNFSLSGGTQNSQTVNAGSYTVTETVPLGWVLTGIGGSTDPLTPYACTVSGSGGSSGSGNLTTMTASITLKNGDTVICVFENTGPGVTRTQGFWATHPQLAQIAWFGGTAFGHTFPGVAGVSGIGNITLCGRSIDTLDKLMGAFWSDISKKTTGAKRSALDQSRMQLLQQLIAAELNAAAFGSVPSSGSFAAWESAYCGSSQSAINTAQQQSASFNSQGDNGTFTPGTSADSRTARTIANQVFWDTLP